MCGATANFARPPRYSPQPNPNLGMCRSGVMLEPISIRNGGYPFVANRETSARSGPVFWDYATNHAIVRATASPPRYESRIIDLGAMQASVWIPSWPRRTEQWIVHYEGHRVLIEIVDGTGLDGPTALLFHVDADRSLESQLFTLRNFDHLIHGRRLRRPQPEARRQLQRRIMQLRVIDALAAGASTRAIAMRLFPDRYAVEDWRDRDNSLRSVIRRLSATGYRNVNGGYRSLLA